MAPYNFIFIAITISLLIHKNTAISKYEIFLFYILLPVFFCMGYMTGSDWRYYELQYNSIILGEYNPFNEGKEPGYFILAYLFKLIGFDFWFFSFFLKFVGYYIFMYIYRSYDKNSFLGIVYAIPFFIIPLFMDFPARNFISIIIWLFNIKNIRERNFKKFIIFSIFAAFFHLSSILAIPIYFLLKDFRRRDFIMGCIFAFILLFIIQNFLVQIFSFVNSVPFLNIDDRIDIYTTNLDSESSSRQSGFSFGFLLRLFLFSMAIKNMPSIEKRYEHGKFILNFSLIYIYYDTLQTVIPILGRVVMCFNVVYFILIAYLCEVLCEKYKLKIIKFIFVVMCFVLSYVGLTITYKYIPYSNYLEYIFSEKPSFEERSQYNYNNSPYYK